MKPCSFWSDGHVAANKPHCSTHGDRHPSECANELAERVRDLEAVVCEAIAVVEGRPIRSQFVAVEEWKHILKGRA